MMRLFKTQRGTSVPGCRIFAWAGRDVTDPQGSHELESRQPVQVLGVPFPECGVLSRLSQHRVVHRSVTKVVNNHSHREGTPKPFIQGLPGLQRGLQRQDEGNRE